MKGYSHFKIFVGREYGEGGYLPIHDALEILTDEFVDGGQCCDQTIIDLRDALKEILDV